MGKMSRVRSIRGLVAFITGAASGLGRGTAEHLVRHGAKVAIADLPSSAGAAVARELGLDNALFAPLDVRKSEDISNALRATEERFSRIDALISCAGLGMGRAVYNVTERRPNNLEDFENVMRVNVVGTFDVMRQGVEYLYKNRPNADGHRGVIVNTAGFAAHDGQYAQVAYAATNGAVVSMTLPAARDLSRLGVRVVTVSPGYFDTPLISFLPEKVLAYLAEQVLSPPRLGRPEEFAHAVRYVVENSYINGEVIKLQAGLRSFP